MISENKIIEIFCSIDDFCQVFTKEFEARLIGPTKKRKRKATLELSEVITIQVLFHESRIRDFKKFYLGFVSIHMKNHFPKLVSYNRFVELMTETLIPMAIYLKSAGTGDCTGISFIDSTPIRVCHNRRIHQHKVFDGIANRGFCSMGWFFGFKLHLVVSDIGQVIDFMITKGSVNDREPLRFKNFLKKLWGKLYGDKGYIGKDLFLDLFQNGIHLVTKLKRNMKSKAITPIMDAILLRKRAVCESIIDQLKNIFQIEHSRHRSLPNFMTNIFSALIAYNFSEKKPSIKMNYRDTKQLTLNF
jgi:hypothetical protein